MRTRRVIALAVAALVLPVSALGAGLTVVPSRPSERPAVQLVFNKQNPRWEAPGHGMHKQFHKPYKPGHEPPGALPTPQRGARRESGVFDGRTILALAGLVTLALAVDWLATATALPAALFALALGLVVGPATGVIDTADLFGPLFLPLAGIAVAGLLFERCSATGLVGLPRSLVDARAAIAAMGLAAVLITGLGVSVLDLSLPLAALLAVLLVIPAHAAGSVVSRPARAALDEAGERDDPNEAPIETLGVLLALVAFEVVLVAGARRADLAAAHFVYAIATGGLVGLLGAAMVIVASRYGWIPAARQRPALFAAVLGVFAGAHWASRDAGFFAVVAMGLGLANRRAAMPGGFAPWSARSAAVVRSVVLLLLAAGLSVDALDALDVAAALFIGGALLARPLAALLLSQRSGAPWPVRLVQAVQTPGAVWTVALAMIFGLRLAELGKKRGSEVATLAVLAVFGEVVLATLAGVVAVRWLPAGARSAAGVGESTATTP